MIGRSAGGGGAGEVAERSLARLLEERISRSRMTVNQLSAELAIPRRCVLDLFADRCVPDPALARRIVTVLALDPGEFERSLAVTTRSFTAAGALPGGGGLRVPMPRSSRALAMRIIDRWRRRGVPEVAETGSGDVLGRAFEFLEGTDAGLLAGPIPGGEALPPTRCQRAGAPLPGSTEAASFSTPVPTPEFDLERTLRSGQTYSWWSEGKGYVMAVGGAPFYVEQQGGDLYFQGTDPEAARRIFNLDGELHPFGRALRMFGDLCGIRSSPGVGALRLDPFECLVTSVLSEGISSGGGGCRGGAPPPAGEIRRRLEDLSGRYSQPRRFLFRDIPVLPDARTYLSNPDVRLRRDLVVSVLDFAARLRERPPMPGSFGQVRDRLLAVCDGREYLAFRMLILSLGCVPRRDKSLAGIRR